MKYLLISNQPLVNILFLSLFNSLISGKNTTIILWLICVIIKVLYKATDLNDVASRSGNVLNTYGRFRIHGFHVEPPQQSIVNHLGRSQDASVPGNFQNGPHVISFNIIGLLAIVSLFLPFDVYIRHSDNISLKFLPVYYYQHNSEGDYKRGLDMRLLNKDYICVRCHILNDVKYGIVITLPVAVPWKKRTVDATSTETQRLDFLRHGQQSHFFLKRSPKFLAKTWEMTPLVRPCISTTPRQVASQQSLSPLFRTLSFYWKPS